MRAKRTWFLCFFIVVKNTVSYREKVIEYEWHISIIFRKVVVFELRPKKSYRHRTRTIVCSNCGETKYHAAMGMCNKCYYDFKKENDPEWFKNKLEGQRKWRMRNQEHINKYIRNYYNKQENEARVNTWKLSRNCRKAGFTIELYDAVLLFQENKCAICETPFDDDKNRPNMDHDHDTGEARGILCRRCNVGLGFFLDNPLWLKRTIEYLKKTPIQIYLSEKKKQERNKLILSDRNETTSINCGAL